MKIALLNDTGAFAHFGCHAVSDAHARMLGRMGHEVTERFFLDWDHRLGKVDERDAIEKLLKNEEFTDRIQAVDAVIVNGEGTIHHGGGLHLLAALGASQRLGKVTLLVNAVYEETTAFEEVLRKLDDFTVRDKLSADFAGSRGIRYRMVFDSCLDAKFGGNLLADLNEKIVFTDWHSQRNSDVGMALKTYMRAYADEGFYFPFERADADACWKRSVATISRSRIFITARHHGIYFAAMARVPFVAMPSNTAKVEGFLSAMGIDMPLPKTASAIEYAVAWASRNGDVYRRISDTLLSDVPLTTFRALGGRHDSEGEAREIARLEADLQTHAASPLLTGEWQTGAISRNYLDAIKNQAPLPSEPIRRNKFQYLRLSSIFGGRS